MTKFHINERGEVNPCTAKNIETCPIKNIFNEKTKHFDNEIEAIQESEKQLSVQYNEFNNLQKIKSSLEINEHSTIPYFLELDDNVQQLINELNTVGKTLIVGGAVRDSLTGAISKDIDIEVHNSAIFSIVRTLRKNG